MEAIQITKLYTVRNGLFQPAKQIRAVDQVSFHIDEGETFGLVGESGCGKTTLGRVLLHLEPATAGQVQFDGRKLLGAKAAEMREVRREMQVIFQDPYGSIDPRWKIGDIIGEPLAVHLSLSKAERKEKVQDLLIKVGLNPAWHDRFPHEFSGGQRQRIVIARAIALRPKFILADEAVSALDVSIQAQIVNLMLSLQREMNLSYLFIAHGLNVVRHISDRIGVMYLGKMVEVAPAEELFRHPAHPYTRLLLASAPTLDPKQKKIEVPLSGELPSPANPPAGCRFHTRCPKASAVCREAAPEMNEVGPRHWTACHFPA